MSLHPFEFRVSTQTSASMPEYSYAYPTLATPRMYQFMPLVSYGPQSQPIVSNTQPIGQYVAPMVPRTQPVGQPVAQPNMSPPQMSPPQMRGAPFAQHTVIAPAQTPQPIQQPFGQSFGLASPQEQHQHQQPTNQPIVERTVAQVPSIKHPPQEKSVPVYGERQSTRFWRRKAQKDQQIMNFPLNYPAHPVPDEMRIPTGPRGVNSWVVVPPMPEEIKSRRYATSVDDRNFLTVLEYELNGQPIIWDYYTGYVHLTGIWKAVGNNKADIVKLLDNSPELEPVIRRVRGGFLKIQGTWVPFEVARSLALHVCYYIRFALVPIFGAEFPSQCLQPGEPGFGSLLLNIPIQLEVMGSSKSGKVTKLPQRRRRSSTMRPVSRHHSESIELSPPAVDLVGTGASSDHGESLYDEDVFEEDDIDHASKPPGPRKLSFHDEPTVSTQQPQELVEMLKATRTLQQLASGRTPCLSGGSFVIDGQTFSWDGSDTITSKSKVEHSTGNNEPITARPEPSPPYSPPREPAVLCATAVTPPARVLSLASILNHT